MMSERLFVGGAAAGEVWSVPTYVTEFKVPSDYRDPKHDIISDDPLHGADGTFNLHRYTLCKLRGRSGAVTEVFVLDGIDAVAELLDFYQKNRKPAVVDNTAETALAEQVFNVLSCVTSAVNKLRDNIPPDDDADATGEAPIVTMH